MIGQGEEEQEHTGENLYKFCFTVLVAGFFLLSILVCLDLVVGFNMDNTWFSDVNRALEMVVENIKKGYALQIDWVIQNTQFTRNTQLIFKTKSARFM